MSWDTKQVSILKTKCWVRTGRCSKWERGKAREAGRGRSMWDKDTCSYKRWADPQYHFIAYFFNFYFFLCHNVILWESLKIFSLAKKKKISWLVPNSTSYLILLTDEEIFLNLRIILSVFPLLSRFCTLQSRYLHFSSTQENNYVVSSMKGPLLISGSLGVLCYHNWQDKLWHSQCVIIGHKMCFQKGKVIHQTHWKHASKWSQVNWIYNALGVYISQMQDR